MEYFPRAAEKINQKKRGRKRKLISCETTKRLVGETGENEKANNKVIVRFGEVLMIIVEALKFLASNSMTSMDDDDDDGTSYTMTMEQERENIYEFLKNNVNGFFFNKLLSYQDCKRLQMNPCMYLQNKIFALTEKVKKNETKIDEEEIYFPYENDDEMVEKVRNKLEIFIEHQRWAEKFVVPRQEEEVCYLNKNNAYEKNVDFCENCNIPLHLLSIEAYNICPRCCIMIPVIPATASSVAFGENVDIQAYDYDRKEHMIAFMAKFRMGTTTIIQENQQTRAISLIPAHVIENLRIYFQNIRATILRKVSINTVKDALKHLNMYGKYKDYLIEITQQMNNELIPQMSDQEFEAFMRVFIEAEKAFLFSFADIKNLPIYSYCAYKICELLGLVRFLPYLKLLKSVGKLSKRDEQWKIICQKKGWKFFPSI